MGFGNGDGCVGTGNTVTGCSGLISNSKLPPLNLYIRTTSPPKALFTGSTEERKHHSGYRHDNYQMAGDHTN